MSIVHVSRLPSFFLLTRRITVTISAARVTGGFLSFSRFVLLRKLPVLLYTWEDFPHRSRYFPFSFFRVFALVGDRFSTFFPSLEGSLGIYL